MTRAQLEEEGSREDEEVLVYLLTLWMKVLLNCGVRAFSDLVRREQGMRGLQEATKVVVRPLQEYELSAFLVKTRELVGWKCLPLVVSHCCNFMEGMDMSAVRHGVAVK